MEFQIRKMTLLDLPDVLAIENVSFAVPWSAESYLQELKNKWSYNQVCVNRGKVVGYAGAWVVYEDAHITNVAVTGAFRGRGLGRALMMSIEKIIGDKEVKRVLLEVRPSNVVALKLYHSMGYYEIARRPAYYQDNQEEAIVMCKNLEVRMAYYV